jgi:beta-lactamase superfamily II metal-dependent hydrolase
MLQSLRAGGAVVVDVGARLAARAARGARRPALRRRGGAGWKLRAVWPRDASGRCDENDRSVTVVVAFGRASLLLAGDLESQAEHELALRPRLRAAVLKAPHHGSKTSSSATLLAAVRPAVAVASCGAANRYGFPHAEVLRRYAESGVPLYRTDLDGAIRVAAYRDRLVVAPARGRRMALDLTQYSQNAAPAR